MLTHIPQALRTAARTVTLRHPNAMDAEVRRRVVMRTVGAESGMLGGIPTLGGMAVLDAEDEAEIDYQLLGGAKVLFCGILEPGGMSDRRDHISDSPAAPEALIEPSVLGQFDVKDGDLVMCMPGGGVVITYEVTAVRSNVHIPPYGPPKYTLQLQGDMLAFAESGTGQEVVYLVTDTGDYITTDTGDRITVV